MRSVACRIVLGIESIIELHTQKLGDIFPPRLNTKGLRENILCESIPEAILTFNKERGMEGRAVEIENEQEETKKRGCN